MYFRLAEITAKGLGENGDPILLITARNAEYHISAVRVYGSIWGYDVQVVLGERGQAESPMQTPVGPAVNLVHGMVSRQYAQACVESVSYLPHYAVSRIDLEHVL